MLNHTYTSVKNANLVDCGKKQHISSQPILLLKDNFLGEFRTELDKKKVLANLGIATELSLEWEYIKGDIGRNLDLIQELDSRTKYTSLIDGFLKTIVEGINYLETIVGSEEDVEESLNLKIAAVETKAEELTKALSDLQDYIKTTVDINIEDLNESLVNITQKVDNITDLIKVSTKEGNALVLLTSDDVKEGQIPGLFVPDLTPLVNESSKHITTLLEEVSSILNSLEEFVTKDDLGGEDFNFVNLDDFDNYIDSTEETIEAILEELAKTVKTDSDGHVNKLYVNEISNNNNDNNTIKITDSFEMSTGVPLDVRFVVDNLDELLALPVKVCYSGMGVIVNSLSSLYILRKPTEGTSFNQEYVNNIYNWKCPEDLVTVAMTRTEYEALEEINPNVFYYIYEDEITRTQEPKREEYLSDEEFEVEWTKWTDSLKILSLEYMSASWGVDIENKLGKKASNASVLQLYEEIKNIQGGENLISLKTLNSAVEDLKITDEVIKNSLNSILIVTDEEESGRLVEAENAIEEVRNSLDGYVSKEYIQDTSNNFIFVKNEVYLQDKIDLENSLKTQIISDEVKSNKIVLNETILVVDDNKLKVGGLPIASSNEIPKMVVLTLEEYNSLELKNAETYYYTFNDDEIYVTKTTLDSKVLNLLEQINLLLERIFSLEKRIPSLE